MLKAGTRTKLHRARVFSKLMVTGDVHSASDIIEKALKENIRDATDPLKASIFSPTYFEYLKRRVEKSSRPSIEIDQDSKRHSRVNYIYHSNFYDNFQYIEEVEGLSGDKIVRTVDQPGLEDINIFRFPDG